MSRTSSCALEASLGFLLVSDAFELEAARLVRASIPPEFSAPPWLVSRAVSRRAARGPKHSSLAPFQPSPSRWAR